MLALALAGDGCVGAGGPKTVHGLVVNVQPSSFSLIGSFDLQADDGRTLTFTVQGDVGFTPSHLREHMVFAQPVSVTYHEANGDLVATRVED